VILGLLLACSGNESRREAALDALRRGDVAAVQAEIAALDAPFARDTLRLELLAAEPREGGRFCPEMETTYGKEKCTQVIGRPHLQGPGL
jgi:hypothetical protein